MCGNASGAGELLEWLQLWQPGALGEVVAEVGTNLCTPEQADVDSDEELFQVVRLT